MPHVTINTWPGKTAEQKAALAARIKQAVVEEFGSGEGHVSVSVKECPPEKWPSFYRDEIFGIGSEVIIEPTAYSEPRFLVAEEKTEYVMPDGSVLAYIEYPAVSEDTVEITHTVVDPSLQGQGIAGMLTERAAVYLDAKGKKIIPTCSYAQLWFVQNAKYSHMIKE